MSVETSTQTYNPLLRRREVRAIIEYEDSPPSRKTVAELVAKHVGVPVSRVVLVKMNCLFGSRKVEAHSHIYDKEDDIKIFEKHHVLKRSGLAE